MCLIDTKYLIAYWRKGSLRPDGRKYRFRHNRKVHNFYIHLGRLEIVLWYR